MKLALRGQRFGKCIRLAAVPDDASDKPRVWMQIAAEGTFKGHPDFEEVVFDRKLFEGVVANLKKHPNYAPGPDGIGTAKVVPFDYEHASEMDPTQGSIPVTGAPAPAWVLDLEVRDGADGKAELWAFTQLGEQAKEQIQAEEYAWTSVAIWEHAVDPVSGEDVGPTLTSVAFTNHPFIQGMAPLAASARGTDRVTAKAEVWGKAESPEEALIGLRNIFGLDSNADASAVQAQLDRLGQFISSGPWPNGVDGDWMLRRLRELVGLPALATWDEIAAAAGGFLSGLVSNEAGLADASVDQGAGESEMKFTSAQLAELLKCRDTDDAILMAAKEAAKNQDAIDKLKALFGSPDTQSVMNDAAALATKVKENEGLLAGLSALVDGLGSAKKDDAPEVAAEEEVAAAVAASAKGLTDAQRSFLKPLIKLAIIAVRERAHAMQEAEAVLASMTQQYGDEHAKRLRPIVCAARQAAIGDATKLAQFRESFPLQDPKKALLTTPLFAGPGSVQMGGAMTGHTPPPNQPITQPVTPQGNGANGVPQHLVAMPGPNTTEKARQYLCAKLPGFKDRDLMSQNFEAGQYIANGAPAL